MLKWTNLGLAGVDVSEKIVGHTILKNSMMSAFFKRNPGYSDYFMSGGTEISQALLRAIDSNNRITLFLCLSPRGPNIDQSLPLKERKSLRTTVHTYVLAVTHDWQCMLLTYLS